MKDKSQKEVRTSILNPELLDEGRKRIVRAAIKVFAEKGYVLSTTRELAQACDMSEAAMYRYVGSKRDILALISYTVENFYIKLRDYEKELKEVTPYMVERVIKKCLDLDDACVLVVRGIRGVQ